LIHTHNSPESGLAAIGLKIQKFAERVGEVTASRLKSGIRALRKIATDQIRQLMQTLANAGYGSVQGEGAEMIYKAALGDRQLQLDLSPFKAIDTVDPQLIKVSIDETEAGKESQASIDTIDTTNSRSASATEGFNPVSANRLESQTKDGVVMPEQTVEYIPQQNLVVPSASAPDVDTTQPPSFHKGQRVEIWRQGQWILATYLKPLSNGILSHRTRQLDDGHQVEVLGNLLSERLLRVAISDLRPVTC
jgi:hypothetical protein